MGIGRTNAGGGGLNKSVIIVTAPTGSTVTCSMGNKTKSATERNGTWTFSGLGNGDWIVTATLDEQTAVKTVTITRLSVTYIDLVYNQIPEFTYTGDWEAVDDDDNPIMTSDGNWKIRFLTSGTLTFTDLKGAENGIDVFLVGAGGGSTSHAVGGCGGGYTRTGMAIHITPNTQYEITIGAGGTGGDGGSTSGFDLTAAGGKGIATPHSNGLDGGSGGAGLDVSGSSVGGSDGANGTTSKAGGGKGQIALPGPNGETGSTREFGERWGRLYASGGSGGGLDTTGPDGGGGGYKQSGKENTGGGGGGRIADSDPDTHGGSGIVIIRNHREVTE